MDCDEQERVIRCSTSSLPSFSLVVQKARTKPHCKRRLDFDDTTLIRKRIRVDDDDLEFSGSSQQVSDVGGRTTAPITCIVICALRAVACIGVGKRMEESQGIGSLKNQKQDELKALRPYSSLLQPDVMSACEHVTISDSIEKMVTKEEHTNDASVLGPSTPSPKKRKQAKPIMKIQKSNLEEVSELAANSLYYTRYVKERIVTAIAKEENMKEKTKDASVVGPSTSLPTKRNHVKTMMKIQKSNSQEVLELVANSPYHTRYATSSITNGRKLKMHNQKVSQNRKNHPSLTGIRNAGKAWHALMKKAIAESCDTVLEKDESIAAEDKSLIFHGKVKSFISKVGTFQGERKYSQWKGSVLDSAVGAFLTQRVSDNFSSSAFMSLGATFPQDRDCVAYSRHHRMVREQRSKGGCSFQSQVQKGNEMQVKVETKEVSDELKKENSRKGKPSRKGNLKLDWNTLRSEYSCNVVRELDTLDYVDWCAVWRADVKDVSNAIILRGMNNKLAHRIKDFLDRLKNDHGNLDLEWVRNVPPPEAKEFLLSIYGLGLKSVNCIQLLTLKQPAFPVDVNVARVTVRLGWVPFPENASDKLLMSILEESSKHHDLISQYLWPRLRKLDQNTLYELHCQMITFGKVFCTKKKPRCADCPMRKECKSYAEIDIEDSDGMGRLITQNMKKVQADKLKTRQKGQEDPEKKDHAQFSPKGGVEAPNTPAKDQSLLKLGSHTEINMHVSSTTRRRPKKFPTRTQHSVYELPDWHPILEEFDDRDPSDLCPYLVIIWDSGGPLAEITPSSGLSDRKRSKRSKTVPGTVMIPYRTALRGNFPLNGTYFQKNEVFADQQSSQMPIEVFCKTLQELKKKELYCGSDLSKIVAGLSAREVKKVFNEGYICTRGFDRKKSTAVALERVLHMSSRTEK